MVSIDILEFEFFKDKVKELSTWDLPDTVSKPDRYGRKTLPEATSDNMLIYMEKINELVKEVNRLKRLNSQMIQNNACRDNC
jgi:hypothetical protein